MELNYTKAQIKAYEKYPKRGGYVHTQFGRIEVDNNAELREGFKEGYEQAEKEYMEKAVIWLKEILLSLHSIHFKEQVVEDFIQYMK